MIPYDDLVAALQAWRARQGLPVSTQQPPVALANTSNGQVPIAAVPAPSSRPGTPPPAPPPGNKRTTAPRMPLPLAAVDTADEHLDALSEDEVEEAVSVDEHVESALIEESHYENEGDDFAMSFGNNGNGRHHNQTSDETLVGDDVPDAAAGAGRSHNTREDW